MALVFMDSCSWDTADIQYKYYDWNQILGAQSETRRVGATSILVNDVLGPSGHLELDLPGIETVIYGSAFYFTSVPSADYEIMNFYGSSHTVSFGIGDNNSFYIEVNGTKYHSANDLVSALTWTQIEIKIVTHPTAGILQVRQGEILIIDESGLNTGEIGENYDFISWDFIVNRDWYMQDIYVCDGTGSKNNDFLGDIKVEIIRPNAPGTNTDFTPSAGANWENVDEVPIDEDATYNESTLVDQKDTYNHDNISIGVADIFGIQQFSVVRKSDVGRYDMKQLLKSGSTEDEGDSISLNDSYTGYSRCFDQNPDTATDWTETTVNAVESGIKTV